MVLNVVGSSPTRHPTNTHPCTTPVQGFLFLLLTLCRKPCPQPLGRAAACSMGSPSVCQAHPNHPSHLPHSIPRLTSIEVIRTYNYYLYVRTTTIYTYVQFSLGSPRIQPESHLAANRSLAHTCFRPPTRISGCRSLGASHVDRHFFVRQTSSL